MKFWSLEVGGGRAWFALYIRPHSQMCRPDQTKADETDRFFEKSPNLPKLLQKETRHNSAHVGSIRITLDVVRIHIRYFGI